MKATHDQSQFILHALLRMVLVFLDRPATPRNTLEQLWGSVGKLALLTPIFWFWTRGEAATVSSTADNGPNTLRAGIPAPQPVATITLAPALPARPRTFTRGK